MGQDLIIRQDDEPDIDIWNMPWQHLKTAITSIPVRQRTKATDSNRTFAGNIKEVDHEMMKGLLNKMGHKEARIYRYISTGAMWNEHQLNNIDKGEGKCRHCGIKVEDSEHVLWKCPVIHKYRTNKDLCKLDTKHIPKTLINGIPTTISCELAADFWGNKHGQEVDDDTKQLIGQLKGHKGKVQEARQMELMQCFQDEDIDIANKNARQAFNALRTLPSITVMPMPIVCHTTAPEEPNVYSDGSWLQPQYKYLGYGGAGVWWPGRNLNQEPASEAENELAHYNQKPDGLEMYTSIGGLAGGSTRTELAAAIVAMSANGPVHVASDSKAFVTKARKLQKHMLKGRIIHKQWKLISDGDLWEHFYKALKAKSPTSFKATWVKGHATEEHISKGITTQVHKAGNFEADRAADIGASLHGELFAKATKRFGERIHNYTALVTKVVKHIIEAVLINSELNNRRDAADSAKKHKTDQGVNHTGLHYPKLHNARCVTPKVTIASYPKIKNDAGLVQSQCFLSNLWVEEASDHNRPITWLELYMIFRIRGYHKPLENPSNGALTRATLDKQLRQFKRNIRQVVDKTMGGQGDAHLFKPRKGQIDALKGVGILGKHASLSCNVVTDTAEQAALQKALVKLNRQISNKKVDEYLKGTRKLTPHAIKMNGKTGWDSSLPIIKNETESGDRWEQHNLLLKPPEETIVFYVCPSADCLMMEPSSAEAFRHNDLDKKLKCRQCHKTTNARNWSCGCNVPWFACDTHQTFHCCAKVTEQKSQREPKATDLLRPNMLKRKRNKGHEELVADENKRARLNKQRTKGSRSEDVILIDMPRPKVPRLLGPILHQRFQGSSRSSACSRPCK